MARSEIQQRSDRLLADIEFREREIEKHRQSCVAKWQMLHPP
jgi:hypothetical protein